MSSSTRHSRYRISAIRPWANEGNTATPQEVRTFFEGKEVDPDDLRALAASFDAEVQSMVQGGGRHEAVLLWRGHHYDLELEPM